MTIILAAKVIVQSDKGGVIAEHSWETWECEDAVGKTSGTGGVVKLSV